MKVERFRVSFVPIVITLEGVNEVLMLVEAMKEYTKERRDNIHPKALHSQMLLDELTKMGY